MNNLNKIKESRNEDSSIDRKGDSDEEKKSNKGSNRSKSSDDSLNKRDILEADSPKKSKKLNLKNLSHSSGHDDVFNKSPRTRNNSDGRKIEIESMDHS
jgi:hypothetical protein